MPDYCRRCSCIRRPSRASTAAPARAIRRGARSARSGIRRGWRSRRRWCPARGSWTRRPTGLTRRRRAAARARLRAGRAPHERAVVRRTTSKVAEALQGDATRALRSASSAPTWRSRARRALRASPAIDFVARQRVRLHDPGDGAGPAAGAGAGLSATATNGHVERTPERAAARGHGRAAVRGGRLPARPRDRALLHRLPARIPTSRSTPAAAAARSARSASGRRPWAATATARARVEHVVAEIAHATRLFPQVKEYFFDDDTFTDDLPRAEAIARGLGRLGVTWSCNAKANVPHATLQRAQGQRPAAAARRLRVRQPGHPQQHQEGHPHRRAPRVHRATPRPSASRSTARSSWGCRARRGRRSRRRSASRATSIPTRSRSRWPRPIPAPRSTARPASAAGCDEDDLVDAGGVQTSVLGYPHLGRDEIFAAVEQFYRRFYFRPRKIFAIGGEMLRDCAVLRAPPGRGARVLALPGRAAGPASVRGRRSTAGVGRIASAAR